MTAYGAMQLLMHTINDILHNSRFSLVGSSHQTIQVVYNELQPWRKILERLDGTKPSRSRKKVNALDGRIKEAIWKLEDSLESFLTQQIPSQLETLPELLSIDLQSLQNEVYSFIEVENMPQDEPISSSTGFHGDNSKMIGLSNEFQELKTNLMRRHYEIIIFHPLIGTAGVGKTTLAMKIYQDPEIHSNFECRPWVTLGRVPQPFSQILHGILAQLCGITQGDEEIVDDYLKERLDGKNCLIVVDDVWETDAWTYLEHSLSDITNGSIHFLFTGRHAKLINANVFDDAYWHWILFRIGPERRRKQWIHDKFLVLTKRNG